jgi:hypothetical protein
MRCAAIRWIVENMETYLAKADAMRAMELAATDSPFTIEIRFLGGLTETQQAAFAGAADRWAHVIVGDLPDIEIDGDLIDDVLILAQGQAIDGVGHILGQAGPTHARRAPDGTWQQPCKGHMAFDTADLAQMEADGTLLDVITHEMGHVLGIGSMWDLQELVSPPPDDAAALVNPVFNGPAAMTRYGLLLGGGGAQPVPVENQGGGGAAGNPLSELTIASLQDLGYEVDLDAADPYTLPDLLSLAQAGLLVTHAAPVDRGFMLPTIPIPVPVK